MASTPDIVVVGAGVMGCSAAYWLSEDGYQVLVLEKEAIACGASGMASAQWLMAGRKTYSALEDKRLSELAWRGFQLHQELATTLPDESGVDVGYREHSTVRLAFEAEEAEYLKRQPGLVPDEEPGVHWLEKQALWELEPHVNRDALGGLVCHQAQVMAYPLSWPWPKRQNVGAPRYSMARPWGSAVRRDGLRGFSSGLEK